MRPHEKVQKLLPKVEPVMWLYDGLNGKIIKWTLANGNDNHDPSVLAYLVDRNGKVFSHCPKGQALFAFRRLREKQKGFSVYSAALATLSDIEGERVVSLGLNINDLIRMIHSLLQFDVNRGTLRNRRPVS